MLTEIRQILQKFADERYKIFSSKLLPPETPLLGVRIPKIRQFAENLIRAGRGEEYLKIPLNTFYNQEEFMLYGMILSKLKLATSQKLVKIKEFVPYINSWSVCDTFCADMKEIKNNPDLFYHEFLSYTKSKAEYQIRFFYVMALMYFITPELIKHVFSKTKVQSYVGFYDKMAVAWMLSVAYIKFPAKTENFLLNTPVEAFVLRKSISKICDSFRVPKEAKNRLRFFISAKQKN